MKKSALSLLFALVIVGVAGCTNKDDCCKKVSCICTDNGGSCDCKAGECGCSDCKS